MESGFNGMPTDILAISKSTLPGSLSPKALANQLQRLLALQEQIQGNEDYQAKIAQAAREECNRQLAGALRKAEAENNEGFISALAHCLLNKNPPDQNSFHGYIKEEFSV